MDRATAVRAGVAQSDKSLPVPVVLRCLGGLAASFSCVPPNRNIGGAQTHLLYVIVTAAVTQLDFFPPRVTTSACIHPLSTDVGNRTHNVRQTSRIETSVDYREKEKKNGAPRGFRGVMVSSPHLAGGAERARLHRTRRARLLAHTGEIYRALKLSGTNAIITNRSPKTHGCKR